jgi:hypothetical protein
MRAYALLGTVATATIACAPSDAQEDREELSFMRAHTVGALAALQTAAPPPLHFARASDEGHPAAYVGACSRDLAFLVHYAHDAMDSAATSLAEANAAALLSAPPPPPRDDPGELPSRAWLLAGIADHSLAGGTVLFCKEVPGLWRQLQRVYADDSAWRDGLAFSATPAVAAVETVLSSGHNALLSLLHVQALQRLSIVAARHGCGDATAMQTAAKRITAALAGPLLWDESNGMLRPSSGNCANLTDVWASALAVEVGAVPAERAGRIVAWFGAHWAEVVQDGQIRHLPAVGDAGGMPAGQYWPATTTWEYQTHANGGYWGEAAGWVLPVIGRNDSVLARRLVRDAIALARLDGGLHEWRNRKFCCNCEGAAVYTSLCMTPYPSTAVLRGAGHYGRSVASVYGAAKRLFGTPEQRGGFTSSAALGAPESLQLALPLHTRASMAVAAAALQKEDAGAANPGLDPDMLWLTEYATMYQAEARECTGCKDCVQPPYEGCFFPPAADPARPAAYSALWTRDFEYTMEFLYPLFDETSRQAALDQTRYIMDNRAAGNCSRVGCTNDEPMFQVKMVVNLANYTSNKTLFCTYVDTLWFGLHSVYTSASFKDDLIWTPSTTTGCTSATTSTHFALGYHIDVRMCFTYGPLAE